MMMDMADEERTSNQIWSDFCSADKTIALQDGVVEKWANGRTSYALWALMFQPDRFLEKRWQMCRDALEPALSPTLRQLHVTVFVAGFVDGAGGQNDDADLERLRMADQALQQDGWYERDVQLHIHGLNSFLVSPFLEVEDTCNTVDAVRSVILRYLPEVRFAPLHLHLTVGRYDGVHSTGELRQRIEPFSDLPLLAVNSRLCLLHYGAQQLDGPLEQLDPHSSAQ